MYQCVLSVECILFLKNKRIVSYIRKKRPNERYQIDLVELNMKGRFKYLCTWVDHFQNMLGQYMLETNK